MALGYTMSLPQEEPIPPQQDRVRGQDRRHARRQRGRDARLRRHDDRPSNDLEKATDLARAMVTQYGMSEKLGPLTFGKKEEMVFLGREISEQRNYSDEVAAKIDAEVREIIDNAFDRAKEALTTHRAVLDSWPRCSSRRRRSRPRSSSRCSKASCRRAPASDAEEIGADGRGDGVEADVEPETDEGGKRRRPDRHHSRPDPSTITRPAARAGLAPGGGGRWCRSARTRA